MMLLSLLLLFIRRLVRAVARAGMRFMDLRNQYPRQHGQESSRG